MEDQVKLVLRIHDKHHSSYFDNDYHGIRLFSRYLHVSLGIHLSSLFPPEVNESISVNSLSLLAHLPDTKTELYTTEYIL